MRALSEELPQPSPAESRSLCYCRLPPPSGSAEAAGCATLPPPPLVRNRVLGSPKFEPSICYTCYIYSTFRRNAADAETGCVQKGDTNV